MARTIAKDHDDKRTEILNTAAFVFARDGFDRASMNTVAKACGVSKANIYHYYSGKEALLFDLLDGYLKQLRNHLISIDDPSLAADVRFRRFVSETLKAYQGSDDHHRVQIASLNTLPENSQTVLRGYQRELVFHLSSILKELAPSQLSDKTKLRSVTMSVFGMLNWYYMWNTGASTKARDEYSDLVTNLTINGINDL